MSRAGILVFIFLVSVFSSVLAGEQEDRNAIMQEIDQLFIPGAIDDLESIYQEYLKSGARTESGIWKLTLFYSSIENIIDISSSEEQWEELQRKVAAWKILYPESAAPVIIAAKMELARGWKYRGNGWAYQVTEAGWEGYRRHVEKAERILLKEKSIGVSDPEWYATMLDVAIARKWKKHRFMKIVDEGLERHPEYYEIPFSAVIYFLPKWYGDPKELEDFVNHVVDRTQHVEGMAMYARTYWVIESSQFGPRLFRNSRIDWEKMKEGIDEVLRKYPVQWNIQAFARYACMAEDREKTRELMSLLRVSSSRSLWSRPPSFKKCLSWSGATLIEE